MLWPPPGSRWGSAGGAVVARSRVAALDVALGGAHAVEHQLARVHGLERALELAIDPQPDHCQRLLDAFPECAGGAGVRVLELVGQPLPLLKHSVLIGLDASATHASAGSSNRSPFVTNCTDERSLVEAEHCNHAVVEQ